MVEELADCFAAAGGHVCDELLHCGDMGEEFGDLAFIGLELGVFVLEHGNARFLFVLGFF
jgi:hypothetical protein